VALRATRLISGAFSDLFGGAEALAAALSDGLRAGWAHGGVGWESHEAGAPCAAG